MFYIYEAPRKIGKKCLLAASLHVTNDHVCYKQRYCISLFQVNKTRELIPAPKQNDNDFLLKSYRHISCYIELNIE